MTSVCSLNTFCDIIFDARSLSLQKCVSIDSDGSANVVCPMRTYPKSLLLCEIAGGIRALRDHPCKLSSFTCETWKDGASFGVIWVVIFEWELDDVATLDADWSCCNESEWSFVFEPLDFCCTPTR